MSCREAMAVYHSLLVILVGLTCSEGENTVLRAHDRLYNDLMTFYNPKLPPASNLSIGEPINLRVMLTPWRISSLDEKSQILTSTVWMTFVWTDDRLTWEAADYEDISTLRLPISDVWKPDIFLQNSAGEDSYFARMDEDSLVSLESDGHVGWYPIQMIQTSCQVMVSTYPFDTQQCPFMVGSWMVPKNELYLDLDNDSGEMDLSKLQKSNEWEVLNTSMEVLDVQFNNSYQKIVFYMTMKRKLSYYTFALIIPCVLLTILTAAMFFIPPQSGEKISLGVAIWTSLVIFLLILVDYIPASASHLPIIGLFNTITLVMITVSLVLTVVTTRLYYQASNTPPSDWLIRFAYHRLAKVMCQQGLVPLLASCAQEVKSPTKQQVSPDVVTELENDVNVDIIRLESNSVDAYEKTNRNCRRSTDDINRLVLDKVSKQLDHVLQKELNQESEDKNMKLWQEISLVFDRLFFWIYLFVILVCCVVVFVVYFT